MESQEITYLGVRLNIEFKVDGKHYPATHETPEEHPDYTVTKITAYDSDVDLTDLLSEEQQQSIYEHLIELI